MIVGATAQMLSRLGYDVFGEADSVAALEEFRARPDEFDIVITDYTMPHLTGYELAREVMSIRPDVPVILMTGFAEAADAQAATRIGIREVVMKPVVARDLTQAIRRVVDQGPEGRA